MFHTIAVCVGGREGRSGEGRWAATAKIERERGLHHGMQELPSNRLKTLESSSSLVS